MITIRYRDTGHLYKCDAPTVREAVERAVQEGVSLRGAALRGADLERADLWGALLCGVSLRGANLRCADMDCAALRGADLRGATLCGAQLRSADLRYASLARVRGHWDSHDVVAEILRRAAGEDPERRAFAGLVLVSPDWCWDRWVEVAETYPRVGSWARDVLIDNAHPDDAIPEQLR